MFKSKILFVVGAGASCEAGLPSGEDIKAQIASLLDIRFKDYGGGHTGDDQITEALRTAAKAAGERSINPYLAKAWRIRDVVPTAISIDNFLDAHRGDKMMEICGKLGIVKSVLDAEGKSALKGDVQENGRFSVRKLNGSWYVGFRNMLTENLSKDEADSVFDNVTIITFNYDRCIERFLVQGLADYYELADYEAEAIVSKLSVYHPYGKVGGLPWQREQHTVGFGSSRTDLLKIASQIKTFTEGMHDEKMLSKMREAVVEAETIVFLGFAFHPINMEILTPGVETFTKRVFATTLGLSDAAESVVEDDIFAMLGMARVPITDRLKPDMAKLKCGDFFSQYFRSLSAPVKYYEDEPPLSRFSIG